LNSSRIGMPSSRLLTTSLLLTHDFLNWSLADAKGVCSASSGYIQNGPNCQIRTN
jgi:hypothetical protein